MTKVTPYQSPLGVRYASAEMQGLWSPVKRAGVWRRIWLALAETQKSLGLDIPDEAISAMRAHLDDANLDEVKKYEKRFRHDVMAHIHHFGDQAPEARAFIHLGATSAFVTDNTDLILLRDGIKLLLGRTKYVIESLRDFAVENRSIPTMAYTHFQPAQLTTVGKRATLWLQDFVIDAEDFLRLVDTLPFRGCKGTTGTQASYLELFDGDHQKVKALDEQFCESFGFKPIGVTGQTYTRKIDGIILNALAGIAESGSKFATDLRLLQHEGEILEPVESDQIGSSAMAYKRNPMRAERVCALARYTISLRENGSYTAATQWLERTLDDSANRRLVLPDAFLATDAILVLLGNISSGLEVRRSTIGRNVDRVMPFMATERWLMLGVQAGGDRQELHEVIRKESWAVQDAMEHGESNDLLERLSNQPEFASVDRDQLRAELDPAKYVGRSAEQVEDFCSGQVQELLAELSTYNVEASEITV